MSGQPVRIVVADDNIDAAQAMAMLLGLDGYDVRCAGDGSQTLEMVRDFKPHVLLVDLSMGELSGLEVATELNRDPRRKHMLVIAVTGWQSPDNRDRALAAGFDHYFVKPADPDTIAMLIADSRAAGRFGG